MILCHVASDKKETLKSNLSGQWTASPNTKKCIQADSLKTAFLAEGPIHLESLQFAHCVLTRATVNLPHISFYIDLNLLKLKLRLGTLILFLIHCAEAQSLWNNKCGTVQILSLDFITLEDKNVFTIKKDLIKDTYL